MKNDVDHVARQLLEARATGRPAGIDVGDREFAYAVQAHTMASLGPHLAWKVGAKSIDAEPAAAPLPATGLLASGTPLVGPAWKLRGVELEVAVRMSRDAGPDAFASDESMARHLDAVLPAIEVVETRLPDLKTSSPLAQLADLQSHGALVLGEARAWPAGGIDLRAVEARLAFNGEQVAQTRGAHAVGDLRHLLAWLAHHAQARGEPLRAGDVVTTGTLTGLRFSPEGAVVEGEVGGIGKVALRFAA